MAISQELLDLLVCPVCKTPVKLTGDEKGLRCATCRIVYPIRDGFPVMIRDEAKPEFDRAIKIATQQGAISLERKARDSLRRLFG